MNSNSDRRVRGHAVATRLSLALTLSIMGVAFAAPTPAHADIVTEARVDAHVQQSSPNSNYATSSTLYANGSSSASRYAFVKVDHPTVPAGETLSAAYLRVFVTGTVPVGATLSADLVTNVWQETNVTYNAQPSIIATAPGSAVVTAGWVNIPITATPGATESYRIGTDVTGLVSFSSQENGNDNGPEVLLDTEVTPISIPSAARGSAACSVVDVSYALGVADNQPATFVTTVDGVTRDTETLVPGTNPAGGYVNSEAEDSSDGAAEVVVNINGGGAELSFTVDTDCVAPHPPTSPITSKIFGMSAPSDKWDERLGDVGACGIEARRIYAELTPAGMSQSDLIEAADAAGMMPVVSYALPDGGGVGTMIAGGYDSWMTNARDYLASLDEPVTATFLHEPHNKVSAADFRAASARFNTFMDHPDIAVGPILNGWLLDNNTATFASYTSPSLLDEWDFVAVDTYQAGTDANPDNTKLGGRAIPLLEAWLDAQGYGDKPIGVGEYNGWTAASLDYGGDQIRLVDEVWFGLVWNSGPTGNGKPLEGSRLDEYKEDKAAVEVKHEDGC